MNTIKISDSMPYLICEKCGGYYELGDGESLADFEACQCGGNLNYTNKADNVDRVDEVDKTTQKTKENDKPKLICSNCLKENEDGIFCSECGGKLIAVKDGKAVSDVRDFKESKQIERLSKRASRNVKSDYYDSGESKDLFERINWLGVIVGAGFFIISSLFSAFIIILTLFGDGLEFNPYSVLGRLILIILILIVLMVISGAIAAYISKSREYFDGALNGLVVGVIAGIIFGIISLNILNLVFNMVLYAIFGTLGGLIGIWFRKIS